MTIRQRHGRLTLGLVLLVAALTGTALAGSLNISNRFSDKNRFRSSRERTDYIILHTTEGGDRSSLNRIRKRGLAHYLVMRDGRVHRVIRRQKVALHAGRSMWDGKQNLDRRSLGIEVVGYHNKPITDKQVKALAELLGQLQKIYSIPDERVLTHSMVAYGKPNLWHRKNHRGRKRCGMQFAQPQLRRRLGLDSRPLFDPDVRAGRLIEADTYLASALYQPDERPRPGTDADLLAAENNTITATRSAWFIAREAYDHPATVYVFPSGVRKRGNQINDWSHLPPGTKVLLDQSREPTTRPEFLTLGRNQTANQLAGSAYDDYSTIYVHPGGRIQLGDSMKERDFRRLPPGTRIFLGFEFAGKITSKSTAYGLCGLNYKEPSTVYLFPGGKIVRGDALRANRIPGGTLILVKS